MSAAQRYVTAMIVAATVVVAGSWRPIHPVPSMAWRWDMPLFVPWVLAVAVAALFTLYAVAREWSR